MDIGDCASLELMDKFCYFGDNDGDVHAAVLLWGQEYDRGRNKSRQLAPLLTDNMANVSHFIRGNLYRGCMRSSLLQLTRQ